MGEVIDARQKFARRTALACMDNWTRPEIIANVARLGEDQEVLIVEEIEQLQLERLLS